MPKLKVPTIERRDKPRSPQYAAKKLAFPPHQRPVDPGARAVPLKAKESFLETRPWRLKAEDEAAAPQSMISFNDAFGPSEDEVEYEAVLWGGGVALTCL